MKERSVGVVLAGGSSRRMGRDKASITVGDETLLCRVARQLSQHVREVLVSVDDPGRAMRCPYRVVVDRAADQGPLCALASAFEVAAAERLLFVSCDMPDVSPRLFSALLTALDDHEIDVALVRNEQGCLEPLLAAYHGRARAAVEDALAAGKRRADAAVPNLRVHVIDAKAPLWNLNTPEELEAYLSTNPPRLAY